MQVLDAGLGSFVATYFLGFESLYSPKQPLQNSSPVATFGYNSILAHLGIK